MAKNLMGEELQIWIGEGTTATTLACATSCSLEMSSDDIDISCKDTGKWGATKRGKMSWTVSSDCLFTVDDYAKLFDTYVSGQTVQVAFSQVANYSAATTPDEEGHVVPSGGWTKSSTVYTGKAQITSLSVSADNGAVATYSVTLNGVGALTKTA